MPDCKMKKIKALFLLLLTLALVFPGLTSCTKLPELDPVKDRLAELVEASAEINTIFFGEGLPTYERVTDPRNSTKVYRDEESGKNVYYYEISDDAWEGKIIAYRTSYLQNFSYLQVLRERDTAREPVYENEEEGVYAYAIEYTEKKYDFYYSDSDPTEYDYVRSDSPYYSIDQIKEAAEKVYSKQYLESLYRSLFVGEVAKDVSGTTLSGLSARYMEYMDEDGNVMLMKSNTYEPLVKERRMFDLDTAEVVKPSNKKYITVSVESWLESTPDNRQTIRLSLILENGKWMLDSGTY